ncbi:MAG: DNA recombination/repair protein RecA, partial [Christensenellales bacterium]|jgi:recombination protein RecA
LKFYASMRLDVRKIDVLKNGNEMIGNRTRVKVVKNKVAPPFKIAEFDILYGEGISREGSILDLAVTQKIIAKSGSWYSYNDVRMAQGRDNARLFLKDNPELCAEIEAKLRETLFSPGAKVEGATAGDDADGPSIDSMDDPGIF